MRSCTLPVLTLGAALVLTRAATADNIQFPQHSFPQTHTHARAGYPECQLPHAQPSNTSRYGGYYVGGGGGLLKRDGRCLDEGTWGWDYCGHHWLRHHVALLWNHGRRAQGGTGAYKTDGPHVPDVIAGSVATVHQLKKKKHGEE